MCGLLKMLGVRIRRVADLDEGALYFSERRLLLLDFELSDEDATDAIDRVLPAMFH
jgi:hypothetical protein